MWCQSGINQLWLSKKMNGALWCHGLKMSAANCHKWNAVNNNDDKSLNAQALFYRVKHLRRSKDTFLSFGQTFLSCPKCDPLVWLFRMLLFRHFASRQTVEKMLLWLYCAWSSHPFQSWNIFLIFTWFYFCFVFRDQLFSCYDGLRAVYCMNYYTVCAWHSLVLT